LEKPPPKKKAPRKQGKAKKFFQNLIDIPPAPSVITDSTGCISRANNAFHKMLGYTEDELNGRPIYDFYDPEGTFECTTGEKITLNKISLTKQYEQFTDLANANKLINVNKYFINKNEKLIPTEHNTVFLQDDNGNETGAFSIIRDVTEQRKSKLEIIQAKEEMENFINISLDPVFITDSEDMETAAVALIACRAGIPCTAIRGISNLCGDRNYRNWRLKEAAEAAQQELLNVLGL